VSIVTQSPLTHVILPYKAEILNGNSNLKTSSADVCIYASTRIEPLFNTDRDNLTEQLNHNTVMERTELTDEDVRTLCGLDYCRKHSDVYQ